jgi:undecaprenyl-diphosphatase
MLVGFFLVQSNLIEKIRSVEIIGWTTLIFGMLLYISDKFKLNKNIKSNFNYKSALIIGLFQILSLIPGVSRSGITITAARLLNFKRYDSLKISFLLSVPTLAAVSIYGLKNLISEGDIEISILSIISIILSFLFSFMTIKYFFKYVQKFNMNIFVIYRLILGLILIYLSYL